MLLVSFNINGIKARHERLVAFIDRKKPDVLCLQEIKTEDGGFPRKAYEALGYAVETFGQKAYNGVALLSKLPMSDVTRGFGDGVDDPQSRFITATIEGVRVSSAYVPNGEAVGSEKYAYKLAWLARFEAHLAASIGRGDRVAVLGDYNIAPADLDVHDPVAWQGAVLVSPPERDAFRRLEALGLVDVLRKVRPTDKVFTWWDYRELGFPRNKGLRIDHMLATPDVAARCTAVEVDREERKVKGASDHAPVLFSLSA